MGTQRLPQISAQEALQIAKARLEEATNWHQYGTGHDDDSWCCKREKGLRDEVMALEMAGQGETQEPPAQPEYQRGQFVWVEGQIVHGEQPNDFPKRARIYIHGISTGIPREFKPVTEAAPAKPEQGSLAK